MTDVPEPQAPSAQSLSALEPLKTPAFRLLWTAGLISNTCLWLNDVAAEAQACGLALAERVAMPANNLMLLFRRLLPLAIGLPLALGALRHVAEGIGLTVVNGSAGIAVATMLAFGVVIWRTAGDLNLADAHRLATELERLVLSARE